MGSLPEQCFVEGKRPIDAYITGPIHSRSAIVSAYDIFAMHNNTLQGADHLAEQCNCVVIIPDLFRGDSWDVENMPPKEGRPFLNAWVQERGSWDKVQPDLLATIKYLEDEGKTSICAYGLCFGAKKLAQAAHLDLFRAVVLAHPSFLVIEDAESFECPVALLPSQGEDKVTMDGFWDCIQKKPFANQCLREDFLDMNHGFASARANYSDPRMAGRARDAYTTMARFFKPYL